MIINKLNVCCYYNTVPHTVPSRIEANGIGITDH